MPLESHFDAIETRIGYRFRDRGMLEHALTHKSRTAEDPSGGVADNESLEFLGDAVLGFVAADVLYRELPAVRPRARNRRPRRRWSRPPRWPA